MIRHATSLMFGAALCVMPARAQEAADVSADVPLPPAEGAEPAPITVNASDPASVVIALQEIGFRAKLTEDNRGDPKIKSAASGVNFSVYFYGCDDDHTNCDDLLLYSIFNYTDGFTTRPVNDWNEDKIIGSAFLDEEQDPGIQHFIGGVYDMNLASFERTLLRWETALADFKEFIDW